MRLKYFQEPITQNGFSDEFPFTYFEKIKPIVLDNVILNPDFHHFGLCFTQTADSYIDDEAEVDHWNEIQITGKESLLYLSIASRIFTHGEKIEKYITSGQSCEVPKIIEMFMKEEGFKDLIVKAKKHIVTYGREPWSSYIGNTNGLGLILNREGNFCEGCLNDPQLAFLNKYFRIRGRFIGNNQSRGLDYHLSWEKYDEFIE